MHSKAFLLQHIIKPSLSLPFRLILLLFLHLYLILIHQRESQRQEVCPTSLRIRVIIPFIILNLFPQLFLLKLPYIQLLVPVHEHLHPIGYAHPLFRLLPQAHAHPMHLLNIVTLQILLSLISPILQTIQEINVVAVCLPFEPLALVIELCYSLVFVDIHY